MMCVVELVLKAMMDPQTGVVFELQVISAVPFVAFYVSSCVIWLFPAVGEHGGVCGGGTRLSCQSHVCLGRVLCAHGAAGQCGPGRLADSSLKVARRRCEVRKGRDSRRKISCCSRAASLECPTRHM